MSEGLNILLVEDNAADVELTQITMKKAKLCNKLDVVRDGVAAMAFLRREGEFADAERPGLILLDLNLPRKDGREVLQEIKEDEALCTIPVVVLTSSDAQADVVRSYGLRCNAYVKKPVGLEGYREIVRAIDSFWFKIVQLPHPD